MTEAKFKNYEVKSEFTGSKKAEWSGNDMPDNWNHHKISVKNTETGTKISFDFWASLAEPKLSSEYDVLNAFYCFITDAIAGAEDFEEFCGNFGYDPYEDRKKAQKVHKSCQKSTEKYQKLTDEDMYDLANELSEIAS